MWTRRDSVLLAVGLLVAAIGFVLILFAAPGSALPGFGLILVFAGGGFVAYVRVVARMRMANFSDRAS